MTRVLVVEDDPQTAAEIGAALVDHGFEVDRAAAGREGLLKAVAAPYNAIVLDRMLPGGLEGLGVLATLRTAGVDAPVLIWRRSFRLAGQGVNAFHGVCVRFRHDLSVSQAGLAGWDGLWFGEIRPS